MADVASAKDTMTNCGSIDMSPMQSSAAAAAAADGDKREGDRCLNYPKR